MEIDRALTHQQALGAALGDPTSWSRWLVVLRAAFGLSLNDEQRQQFSEVAGGRDPPTKRVRELWCVTARRSGKSRMAAAIAVYIACFTQPRLARGERGRVLVLAMSMDQAQVVFDYALAFLTESPVLCQEIVDTTRNEIRLRNNITITIHSNSFRSVRGRTLLACIFDEVSFWRDETSTTPDIETYRAVLPALLTTNGMLIGISTPYRRIGLLHAKHKQHFGQNRADVLVVQGTNAEFNLTLDAEAIEAQRRDDPESGISEWGAEFRTDISSFLDDQLIEASIDYGRSLELLPQTSISYSAFADPSGGRGDAFTLAIGHRQDGRLIVDCVRGKYVTIDAHSFDPMVTVKEFAELLAQYNVMTVVGDAYSAGWNESTWRQCGVTYEKSDLPKSEIYLEVLPLFTRGLVSLPDHNVVVRELRLLERHTHRSGRDSVDHGRSGHDDYANAVCGLLRNLAINTDDIYSSPAWPNAPPPPEPKPFEHISAERQAEINREYWQGLSQQVYNYSGGRFWPR